MGLPARFCLVAGVLGLLLCVLNQLTAAELSPALERADVLASLLAVGLMLVAILWTRAVPLAPERVDLQGRQGLDLAVELPEALREDLAWGSQMLLTATPGASLLLHWRGQTLLRRGVLAEAPFNPGPICARACSTGRAISLVNLALYPGREEFRGLPEAIPAVVVQPIGPEGVLLLAGWSPRCFSRSDEAWVEGWCLRLRRSLEALPQPAAAAQPPAAA